MALLDSGAEGLDVPGRLMAESEGQLVGQHARFELVHDVQVGVTRPRGGHPDQRLAGTGVGVGDIAELGLVLHADSCSAFI